MAGFPTLYVRQTVLFKLEADITQLLAQSTHRTQWRRQLIEGNGKGDKYTMHMSSHHLMTKALQAQDV
jgi:hypothetical protein